MSSLFWAAVLGVVLFTVVFLINPLTGKAILATISGSTGAFGRWLRSTFPNWIMQYEIDKAGREINYYWSAIEENKSHSNGLERRKNDKQREVIRLDKLATQAVSQNTPEGDAEARSFLRDKKRIQTELDDIAATLESKKADIESALANITSYEEKVAATKAEAESKSLSLKTKRVDAALSKKLANLNDLNNSGLALAKEALDNALDKAQAEVEIGKVRNRKVNAEQKYERTIADEDADNELAALKAKVAAERTNASTN